MQLYSFFNSSTSYRVRIALALKGVAYDYHGINIRIGEQSASDYVQLNPSKGVPFLVDDEQDFQLNQSLAILDYLDARFPNPPLLPENPKLRAQIRAFAYGIACDMHPINNLRVLKYLQTQLNVSDEQKMQWYQHWIAEGFQAAEQTLAQHEPTPFCFGNEPTLADICLVPQMANAERFGCDLTPYPRLNAVYQHCLQQAAFQAASPEKQPDFQAV